MIDLTFRNINPNLAGNLSPPPHPPPPIVPCWITLNNSEMVKVATLAICSSQQHFIRDIRAKVGIPKSTQILSKTQTGGIFWVSGQFLVKENCHNSRTSNDIGMRLGPVITLDKRIKRTSKKWRWRHVGKS